MFIDYWEWMYVKESEGSKKLREKWGVRDSKIIWVSKIIGIKYVL